MYDEVNLSVLDDTNNIAEAEEDAPYHNSHSSTGCSTYNPECLECKLQRHLAMQSKVPQNVWQVSDMEHPQ